jgi:hypothetical protein
MSRSAKLCLLGAVFALCGAAALFQSMLERHWQATPPIELYQVVSQQLAAFRAEDYPTAYRQVSMGFQEKFNILSFANYARIEYPALLRAVRVEFGQVRFRGRHAVLPAYFIMPEGDVIPCVYDFIHEEDAWKIDGARVLPQWPSNRRLGGVRA